MLNENYESAEELPTGFEHLYVEGENGTFTLRAPTDIKTVDDTTALNNALVKERSDHKAAKQKLSTFEGLDPDEVRNQLDEIESLRAAVKPDTNVDDLVSQRLNAKMSPLQREIEKLKTDLEDRQNKINEFETKQTKSKILSEVTEALAESKIRSEAVSEQLTNAEFIFTVDPDTGNVVTKDGLVNVPVGLTPEQYVAAKKESAPYLWPDSQGADASGSDNTVSTTTNPFDEAGGTFNMTAAAALIKSNPTKAKKLADAVGYKLS